VEVLKMEKMTYQEVIECLENLKSEISFEENRYSLDVAIKEIGKCIPMKPINNGNWSAKTCPTCGNELSIHFGDGYYKDSICLESCPECRQLLDWE
jgi:hypothetical protein